MSRKFLIFLALAVFTGGLIFSFLKFTKAAQAPVLNNLTAISACGFSLNFSAPEPASRFKIQTSKSQNFGSPNLIFNATDENGNQISGGGDFQAITTARLLEDEGYGGGDFYNPSMRYYFRLKLVPAGGGQESGWSNALDAVTNGLPQPPAPQNLRANGGDDGFKNYLLWERGTPVPPIFDAYGGYEIWRAVSTNGGEAYGSFSLAAKIPAVHSDGTPFLDYEDNNNGNWLNPNYSYKYYLKAYQSDRGCKDNQVIVSGASNEALVPVRPDNLAASAPVPNQVELSWRDNSTGLGNETSFEIWRAVDSNGIYNPKYSAPADATSFTDGDVQPNRTYFYKIKACIGASPCSAFSNEASIATGAAAVDDLIGRVYFVDQVSLKAKVYLSWDAELGNVYTALRKDVASGTEIALPGCSGNSISECYDSNASVGRKYEYKLKIEKDGNVNFSNIVPINLAIKMVLKGEAWSLAGSSGLGWIKFKSDDGAAKNYSVQINDAGEISGAAWASTGYGWLSFNKQDLAGCPSGACEARLDSTSGALSGWAKFLGWDGWLRLGGTNYGVSFTSSTRLFSGYGWGDKILGWAAFGAPCLHCNVSADLIEEVPEEPQENKSPVVSGVILEAGPSPELWCDPNPYYRVRWAYSDPDSDPQAKAEIRFAPNNFATTSEGTDISFRLYDPLAVLTPNVNYAVWVRVFDGEDWSDWVSSNGVTTPDHYPPLVDFSWTPSSIVVQQPVTFMGSSTVRSNNGAYSPEHWSFDWVFNNGTPGQAASESATTVFSVIPSDVSLTVDDSGDISCDLTKSVGGGPNTYRRRIFRER